MKRYKDMTVKELQSMLKKTRSDRSEMRMRVTDNPNLSAYDKQIEELQTELARRNDKDGNEVR